MQQKPFPQAGKSNAYSISPLMPSGTSQEQLNADVINSFKKVLPDFIVDPDPKTVNDPDQFRMVMFHTAGGGASECQVSCSESMGYGMLMLAYMAGADDEIKKDPHFIKKVGDTELTVKDYFDAMFRSLLQWPSFNVSGINHDGSIKGFDDIERKSFLMSWEVLSNEERTLPFFAPLDTNSSATDGDMDIAYALLLADKQWGSKGKYNYYNHAIEMIDDIWNCCVDNRGDYPNYHLLLGNWTGTKYRITSRPSDFMLSHLEAFKQVDTKNDWQKTINATYECIRQICRLQEPMNGLLPDFVSFDYNEQTWSASKRDWLEGDFDGTYFYNACRTPWRLGMDILLHGHSPVDECVGALNYFMRSASGSDFNNICGASLDGTFICKNNSAFSSPFLVTAATFGDQEWFDSGWEYAKNLPREGNQFGDYLNVLSMITASGNWWCPEKR